MENQSRINVYFEESIFLQIKERAKKHDNQHLAKAVRELVELGLRVEEATQDKDSRTEPTELMLPLVKNLMIWTLETRFNTRELIKNDNQGIEFLEKSKERALAYVEGLFEGIKK